MYVHFCVKRFELSHVMDTALYKCYALLLLLTWQYSIPEAESAEEPEARDHASLGGSQLCLSVEVSTGENRTGRGNPETEGSGAFSGRPD